MFTGLVREVGVVRSLEPSGRLTIEAPAIAADAQVGDSVAVDGACLTVVGCDGDVLAFDAVPETRARTCLGRLEPGSRVNLEPSLRAGDALGGHYVQGHVDGVGSVRSVDDEEQGRRVWFDAPEEVLRYVVEKGSVAVNGTSLTVAGVDESGFSVALIPHTLEVTTFADLLPGAPVNLEADVLAKYVEKLVSPGART